MEVAKTDHFTFVVIGGGIAGVSCVEMLSHLCPDESILLITASHLVKAVANVSQLTQLLCSFDVEEQNYGQLSDKFKNLTVIKDTVKGINAQDHTVLGANGSTSNYNHLCLCHGASPKLVSGHNEFVLGIRDTESVQIFQERLKGASRVAIVGNGGIATELVHELKQIEIVWAIKDSSISAAFVDPGAGQFYLDCLKETKLAQETPSPEACKRWQYSAEQLPGLSGHSVGGSALGPDWHRNLQTKGGSNEKAVQVEFSCEIQSVWTNTEFGATQLKADDKYQAGSDGKEWNIYVQLSNGVIFGCDFLVSATGVTPNGDKIGQGLLDLDSEMGIKVDDNMRTNLKDVFAAGDVCSTTWIPAPQWFQMRLWTQARQMGLYAGQCMTSAFQGESRELDFSFEMFTHVTRFFGFKMLAQRRLWARSIRQMSIFRSRTEEERIKHKKMAENKMYYPVNPEEEKQLPTFEYASVEPNNRIYLWGMACYGALGNPDFVRPKNKKKNPLKANHHPTRCSTAEKRSVTAIGCGHGFTIFGIKDQKHHILGTGINTSGQLGYHAVRRGHPLEVLISPVATTLPIEKGHNVRRVACGRAHTLVLSSDNQVFSLGDNGHGQCGRPVIENEDYLKNQVIHTVKGDWLAKGDVGKDVICGQDHSFVLTEGGNLHAWGWGADGQLGSGHYHTCPKPTQVGGDILGERIVKVSSAGDCVLALNDQGEVFGWGNSEYGQFASITDEQQISLPHKLNTRGLGKIQDIASGGTVCLVLNENHDVFTWGYGILGKGPNLDYSKTPELIPKTLFGYNEFNTEVKVKSVHAGVHTQGAVNSNGELFTWGQNKGSCLGLGNSDDQYFPLKVSIPGRVRKLSMG
eukprot:maker-scaffold460_size165339-snap-gene-0.29 protein:Tk08606 transcript:maker-scaffold460_size165339-snap-gene-0.29-mRNA-1 annotation:"hypothetical protein DAPPUDRAFT_304656"